MLTDTQIKNAAIEAGDKSEKILTVGDNLVLRVRAESKTWLFIYRVAGGRKKISLGRYPTVPLKAARAKAEPLRQWLEDGRDPAEELARQEADATAAKAEQAALPQTVGELFDLFEKQALASRKDKGASTRRAFDKDVLPTLAGVRLTALKKAHLSAILNEVERRGAARSAGLLLGDFRQMCRWAVRSDFLPADLTTGWKKSDWHGQAGERERVLSESEIKTLSTALPGTLSPESQAMVWIILATACRVGEISHARWSDCDLEAGTWTIPAANSKNAKPITIALSVFALGNFQQLRDREVSSSEKEERPVSEWVFPARRGLGAVDSKSLGKQLADRQRPDKDPMSNRCTNSSALVLPGGIWRPHDLRRTAATLMASLGVQPNVIERCLNHVEQKSLVRIYQRHTWAPEMAEAWRLLGDRLDLLTRPDAGNVALLSRAAA